MTRAAALLVAGTLLLGACGGRSDEIYERPPVTIEDDFELPAPVPAAPAYVVRARRPLAPNKVEDVQRMKGVAVAAPIARRKVRVEGPAGTLRLRVAVVEPLRLRPVAPPATRDADFVWLALLSGDAVVTFDAAERLGLDAGGTITLPGTPSVGVGAFADNGRPNFADVLVPPPVGTALGMVEPSLVVVGAKTGVTLERLGRSLKRKVPGAHLDRIVAADLPSGNAPQPVAQPNAPPMGRADGSLVGTMSFEILKNGFIRPDPGWIRSNIAAGDVPVIGRVTCHRLMFRQLRAALGEVQQRGLARLIRPGDYGGCWVPRFIDRDPSKPLSMHAFGLAIDFNVSTNGLGSRGDMDARVVAIFEKWGFEWGGRWSRPDPMHFELARLIGI